MDVARSYWQRSLLAAAAALVAIAPAAGQGPAGPVVSDTRVGYIDSAVLATQVRWRVDAGYGMNAPARAEYFYARPRPTGPGLQDPETRIDYQDLSMFAETRVGACWSVFVEAPLRWLNPEINGNALGIGDLNAGCKWAWLQTDTTVLTGLLRVYVPTGDAGRGLGNRHVSIEPGLLGYQRVTERWGLEAEVKGWLPVGGTDFAGEIIRYGLGMHYDIGCVGPVGIAPVVELVGWTALSGQVSEIVPGGAVMEGNAAGDTIINLKAGARIGMARQADLYIGYSRALTGDRWYQDMVRVEFRLFR